MGCEEMLGSDEKSCRPAGLEMIQDSGGDSLAAGWRVLCGSQSAFSDRKSNPYLKRLNSKSKELRIVANPAS
jgi:hypothetical protein